MALATARQRPATRAQTMLSEVVEGLLVRELWLWLWSQAGVDMSETTL